MPEQSKAEPKQAVVSRFGLTSRQVNAVLMEADGKRFDAKPGMQVISDIQLGERTLLEYLTSPPEEDSHGSGSRTMM